MTELQKKLFELLRIVVGICEKWDIPYYLVCGSALGAVKYGGFIPWDDDIDVGLLRDDYDRFLEIAPKELPDWCFLQNYKTEKDYPMIHSKLRDSRTTFIEKGVRHLTMNHGIYIDIFPLDGYPVGFMRKVRFSIKEKWYNWMRFCTLDDRSQNKIIIRNKLFRLFGYNKRTAEAVKKLDSLYASFPVDSSPYICNYGNWQGEKEYAPRWHYGAGTWTTFEGLRVRIPENYDAYLTQKYGDWRADLPDKKKISHHHAVVCDPDRPYTFYL